jgi:hypothetical protein
VNTSNPAGFGFEASGQRKRLGAWRELPFDGFEHAEDRMLLFFRMHGRSLGLVAFDVKHSSGGG